MVTTSSPVLVAALRWVRRGAAPIAVRFRDKVPLGEAWQKQRLTAIDVPAVFNGGPLNLGILWGEPSGHLIDIDLDWPEACAVAAAVLPATATYGRASARGSHWLYRVEGAVTRQWTLPPTLAPAEHRAVVLELRAEGAQSVVPPSTHPSGELYEWAYESKPHVIQHEDLLRRLNLVAAGALLVQFWREGARHQLAPALSGAALSAGYTFDEVASLVTGIATAAGDLEALDRVKAAQSSATALAAGRPATGVPRLAELVGEQAVMVLKRWLGLASAVPVNTQVGAPSWTPDDSSASLSARGANILEGKPMHWLWPNRIARGKLNLIAGEPGVSKSVLTCAIAGIVSTGGTWPLDGTRCESGEVLMLNVEDDPEDTIQPRLRAAGADLARVTVIDGINLPGGKLRPMTLADVPLLERYLEQHPGRFTLLTCDPVGALMADRDTHRDSDVRGLLAPLAAVAMRHDLAVLIVAHLNKGIGMKALHRVVGSIGFVAAVRMAHFVVLDPENNKHVLVVPGKANLAPMGMAGLSYELESADLGKGIVAPRILWHDVPEMRNANELLNPVEQSQGSDDRDEAETWLRQQLAGGPVLVRELREASDVAVAVSWDTVERIAKRLGVVGEGERRVRTWMLPDAQAKPHKGITASAHEPTTAVKPDSAAKPHDTGSQTYALMPLCGFASEQNGKTAEQHELLVAAKAEALPACTDCGNLNAGGFCSHYQRVLPEPSRPTSCIHFVQRAPDVPW